MFLNLFRTLQNLWSVSIDLNKNEQEAQKQNAQDKWSR